MGLCNLTVKPTVDFVAAIIRFDCLNADAEKRKEKLILIHSLLLSTTYAIVNRPATANTASKPGSSGVGVAGSGVGVASGGGTEGVTVCGSAVIVLNAVVDSSVVFVVGVGVAASLFG